MLFQYWTVTAAKKFFLMSTLNLFPCVFNLLVWVILSGTKKSKFHPFLCDRPSDTWLIYNPLRFIYSHQGSNPTKFWAWCNHASLFYVCCCQARSHILYFNFLFFLHAGIMFLHLFLLNFSLLVYRSNIQLVGIYENIENIVLESWFSLPEHLLSLLTPHHVIFK